MYERKLKVRGVIRSNGLFYAQKLKDRQGKVNEFWSVPGGGVDDGEAIEDALFRELIEETGVTPVIGRLLAVQQFSNGSTEVLEFFFDITNPEDFRAIDLTTTTHGSFEVSEHGFIDPSQVKLLPEGIATLDKASAHRDVVFFKHL